VKRTILACCILLLMTAPAYSFNWTYHDFGTDVFDHNNNTSPIDYPNVGLLPSPGTNGEGGEPFDLEGLFYGEDECYLYIGLTSSFGLTAMSEQHGAFASGDVFFGFNGDMYTYGIDVETGNLYGVESWSYVPDRPGGYGGRASIKEQVGAYKIESGNMIDEIDMMLTFEEDLEPNPLTPPNDATGDTWIWEFRIAKAYVDYETGMYNNITIHNTLECGNDLIEETFPTDPIPEPATLILLGVGLAGAGMWRKRRS